jgi:polyisoprenoid-binding protein YceI
MTTATTAPLAGSYSADRDHSSFAFAVRHMGVSTFRGSFSDVEASAVVGADGSLRLDGAARADSISIVSPPDLRAHVLSAEFLDAERHPQIVFSAAPAHPAPDGTIEVQGLLTIRNVTLPVVATGTWSAPIEDPYGATRAALELSATIDRRDYGITWNMALPKGGDALGTQVTLSVALELIGD